MTRWTIACRNSLPNNDLCMSLEESDYRLLFFDTKCGIISCMDGRHCSP